MARYVLHTSNPDGPTADELMLIGQQGTIVDRSRRALLVDLRTEQAHELVHQLPGWTVQPEVTYPIPDTRKKLQ